MDVPEVDGDQAFPDEVREQTTQFGGREGKAVEWEPVEVARAQVELRDFV
jgi:hypothetical protein